MIGTLPEALRRWEGAGRTPQIPERASEEAGTERTRGRQAAVQVRKWEKGERSFTGTCWALMMGKAQLDQPGAEQKSEDLNSSRNRRGH